MSQTAEAHPGPHAHHEGEHAPQAFIWKYVFSKDHKVIAVQYYITAMLMALIAGLLAMFIRLQLAWPEGTTDISTGDRLYPERCDRSRRRPPSALSGSTCRRPWA